MSCSAAKSASILELRRHAGQERGARRRDMGRFAVSAKKKKKVFFFVRAIDWIGENCKPLRFRVQNPPWHRSPAPGSTHMRQHAQRQLLRWVTTSVQSSSSWSVLACRFKSFTFAHFFPCLPCDKFTTVCVSSSLFFGETMLQRHGQDRHTYCSRSSHLIRTHTFPCAMSCLREKTLWQFLRNVMKII